MDKNIKIATILAISTAIFSGFANFINKMAVGAINDAVLFTTLKNLIVAVLLGGILAVFYKWKEIKSLSKKQWLKLLVIGVIGGSIPFILFFVGLTKTSAINASLIHKSLFLWIALLAVPLLKEKFTRLQWIAVGIIFTANFIVGGFNGFKYNFGELMIFGATILWAVENVIAKVTLRDISALTVAGARMIIGSIVLVAILFLRGTEFSVLTMLDGGQWFLIVVTSFSLLGYVLTWYSAVKLAPVTYVAILLTPATLITNILSAVFISHSFTFIQVLSGILFITGIIFLIMQYRLFKKELSGNIQFQNYQGGKSLNLSQDYFSGLLRCTRYAFGPNRLGYCGPDANEEILSYIKNNASDNGLKSLIEKFNTLRPYLELIAKSNGIKDIFDDRVVQAYWIGNELLDNVEKRSLYNNLVEDHKIKKRINIKSFRILEDKMKYGPVPHHSFHVFNIWRRTGHLDEEHTLLSMDNCRISWGYVKKAEGSILEVETEPLLMNSDKLYLGEPVLRKVESRWGMKVEVGDIITMHWGVPCEVITKVQLDSLKKETVKCISISNG